jgi:hypothetical protein
MAKSEIIRFFGMLDNNPSELDRLSSRNRSEILFHSKSMGYDYSSNELAEVIGSMEWYIITKKDKEELNAYSSLWKKMWGKSRLDYLINVLYKSLNQNELEEITSN